jgi:O-antigen/teichoic acid export membrane protein
VLKVGITFFFIQVGSLIVFQTANIIIAKFIGPVAVAEFSVAYKLFSIIIFGFTIILTPYWSAFTEAYARKDFDWIRKNVRRTRMLWVFFAAVLVPVLLLFSSSLYTLWVGDAVHISFSTSLAVAAYAVVYMGMAVSAFFVNGVGRINLQKYLYIVVCIINVPLSIWMANMYGVPGVVLSSTALMAVMMIALWLQTDRILNEMNIVNLKPVA